MSKSTVNNDVVWTPQMPDRRNNDRRGNSRNVHPNGQQMKINDANRLDDRRAGNDRRIKVTVTITGRAIEVEEKK